MNRYLQILRISCACVQVYLVIWIRLLTLGLHANGCTSLERQRLQIAGDRKEWMALPQAVPSEMPSVIRVHTISHVSQEAAAEAHSGQGGQ